MIYNTKGFLDWIYDNTITKSTLQQFNGDELKKTMLEKREQLIKSIGLDKLYTFDFKPHVNFIDSCSESDYTIETYCMEILPQLKFNFYLLKPNSNAKKDSSGYKTVVYCCGHGEGANEVISENNEPTYQKKFPILLAKRGYHVITLEFVGFGNVLNECFDVEYHKGCYSQSTIFLMHGFTMTAMRIFQVQKIVEYIKSIYSLSDIAVHGVSGGGKVAIFLSAIDDNYVGCAISGYTSMYKTSIMSLYHCVDNFIPNILSVGEMPDIAALAAPKHLLISSGTEDNIFPVESVKEAIAQITNTYRKLGIENNITVEIFDGIHEISLAKIFEWLENVLYKS